MLTMFRADEETSKVSVTLLGDCRVSYAGKYLSSVPFGFFRIAAFVLLEGRGQPVLRRRIGRLLWSESDPAQASADIRQTVARIRRFQSEHNIHLISADAASIWMERRSDISCDLVELVDLLENPAPSAAVRLCELYGGELLGSLGSAGAGFEEWLAFQRPRLHDEFVDVVAKAILPDSGLSRQQRDYCARRLMKVDPCHEGAYRALMRGAAESGQTSVVRHLFEDCSRKLREDLGVGPDAETTRLYQQLTRGSAAADV